MSIALEALSFVPGLLWAIGTLVVGAKHRFGWAILFAQEGAWVALALVTRLYGLLPWCGVGFVLYALNWRRWRLDSGGS